MVAELPICNQRGHASASIARLTHRSMASSFSMSTPCAILRPSQWGHAMGLGQYLFSFSGRINRAKQWALLLVFVVNGIIVSFLFASMIGFAAVIAAAQGRTTFEEVFTTPQAHIFWLTLCALYVLGLYITLAVSAKRLHDRNKSAWWLLIFYGLPFILQIPAMFFMPTMFAHFSAVMEAVRAHAEPPLPPVEPPFVVITRGVATLIFLWAFIELYCLRGTTGDNRFGADPLAGRI
jgi:uncharacterized membrane protein YhaH (DUF805 family)